MPLDTDMTRISIMGTDHTATDADTLLQTMGRQHLERRFTGRVKHDHLALDEPVPDDAPLCSPIAQRYLRLLLAGTHRQALPELTIALARRGQVAPVWALPLLLKIGQLHPRWQPYLVHILGTVGIRLATSIANQPWNWSVLLTKMMAHSDGLSETIAYDRAAFQPVLIENSSEYNFRDIAHQSPLVWTIEEYETFVYTLTQNTYWFRQETKFLIELFGYHLPLEPYPYTQLRKRMGDERWQRMQSGLAIVRFRQRMMDAIAQADD